ncbi:CIC11C00000003952 [Sungouiella intermedia]|uniref:CIC11C00000003952 n=1 Tax=Sungouiella intermedia TaxID=45354 RepID=A0A1L0BNP9_9ASCO|nr:CIC11C00000003952 [[Candida] intermedia]
MYIPAINRVDSWDEKKKLIQEYPLGTVVTTDADGKFIANHFPFFLHEDKETGKWYLQAHVAKKNHQVPSLTSNDNVLVIFQTPESYISPSYYPEKEKTHKFVPTWDFGSLHVHGKLRIIDDFDYVRRQLENFSSQQELKRETPWKLSDAPEGYLRIMQKAITGLEIEIGDTECKLKFEQKMSRENIDGVYNGLVEDGVPEVAEYVKQCNLE